MNLSVTTLAKQWRREGKCAKCGGVRSRKLYLRIRRKLVRGIDLFGLVRTDGEIQPCGGEGGGVSTNCCAIILPIVPPLAAPEARVRGSAHRPTRVGDVPR